MSVIDTLLPRCDLCRKRPMPGNGVDVEITTCQGGVAATKTFRFCNRCYLKRGDDIDRMVEWWPR